VAAIAADEPLEAHVRAIAASARTIAAGEAAMSFTIQAQVRHPRGPGAIRRVTADVSKLGASQAEILHDDGAHNDGKAGDGTYATTVSVPPTVLQQHEFRERLLLTVTAVDDGGASDRWPAVVCVPRGPAAVSLMHGGYDCQRAEGPVAVRWTRDEAARSKSDALCFTATGAGPWRAAWVVPGDGVNSAGLKWFSFRIRGDVNQELIVHLVDHHRIGNEGFLDEPHFSKPVPLIASGYLKAVTAEYQEVRVPLEVLLPRGLFFLRWHTAGIGLSAPAGSKPGTYYVDRVQVEP
jgi:hypothetical protein